MNRTKKHNDLLGLDKETLPDYALGVKRQRSCLMCNKVFKSAGSFNRRCPACSRLLEKGKYNNSKVSEVYKISNNSTGYAETFEGGISMLSYN